MRTLILLNLLLFTFQLQAQGLSPQSTAYKAVEQLTKEVNKIYKGPNAGPNADQCEPIETEANTDLQNVDGIPIDVSVISYEQLIKVFDKLASNKKIPFKYPEDGCYARAHQMALIMEKMGIISAKVFIEGEPNLKVETANSPKGYVEWWYHVAPVVKVKKDGKEMVYVLDPSMSDKPMPVQEWSDAQTQLNKSSKVTYYTSRFNFQPMDRTYILKDYRAMDLATTKEIIKKYLKVQDQRKKARK